MSSLTAVVLACRIHTRKREPTSELNLPRAIVVYSNSCTPRRANLQIKVRGQAGVRMELSSELCPLLTEDVMAGLRQAGFSSGKCTNIFTPNTNLFFPLKLRSWYVLRQTL